MAESDWRERGLAPEERADLLIARMTLEEKVAQLGSAWLDRPATGEEVAPHERDKADSRAWPSLIARGLGQLSRPYGTVPADPTHAGRRLARRQSEIVEASRFRIPALAHEECLTGFSSWKSTVYPTPLSWGASFDPALIEEMAGKIGRSMRKAGVHQGLAPVLDVTRDYRWGRTEETIGEDPYLVGSIGSAYVRGLERAGVVATPKHFAGYSASRGGRNLAPVSMGQRELADIVLPPFEMALRLGGARSIMHSYAEIDGVPVAADERLLTGLLRETWGFGGTVVADYFAVRFLVSLHGVAAGAGDAAGQALRAGIDVELPWSDAYGADLVDAVRSGTADESLIDRALRRVLAQKAELGLLDEEWSPEPALEGELRLDDDESRELALRVARESAVLLRNREHLLPLRTDRRVALVGPVADDPLALLGCYAFPVHVGPHPERGLGVEIPTLRQALSGPFPDLTYAPGCAVKGDDASGIEEAATLAAAADVCVLAVGDRSGLFGRGTSGEGCDAVDLRLPGRQPDLVRAVLATGRPVVLVLIAGRPYALGEEVEQAGAIVSSFFPGQLGGQALAEVLTGTVDPSGRLPVSVPRDAGGLPTTYLAPPLARRSQVSSVDPTPAFPFGHGLSYTTFVWGEASMVDQDAGSTGGGPPAWPVDGELGVEIEVENTGAVAGAEVVQLYLHDPVAQTTRPVVRLLGFARVALEPRDRARVRFAVDADLTSFTGRDGRRIVEPGDVELRLGRSSQDIASTLRLRLQGAEREVGYGRRLLADWTVVYKSTSSGAG